MPSPFPGMNPYLEQVRAWHDFHERFIPKAAEQITPQVRPAYIVRIDEHVYIAPVYGLLSPAVDMERHAFLEIQDRYTREVITVIELLSPSNKSSDREQYLAKRRQFLASPVHLVELDLLRGGPRLSLQNLPKCDYYAIVSRAEERPRVGVWPIRLRDRLPVIPIPLRSDEPAARLDLQEVVHLVYDAAAYEDYIYKGEPEPRLRPADAKWARQFLPSAPSADE
jgi:hypothetical protein